MTIEEAIAVCKAAGYRVTKPKPKKEKRVGPTCVVHFHDGKVVRMSTHCNDEALDYKLGTALCIAGWQAKWRAQEKLTTSPWGGEPIPTVKGIYFERDGKRLDSHPSS